MTEETTNLQIEVRVGHADQREVGLTANEPVDPFTVGTEGSWKVHADGVAKVHAYLFFDGTTLFVSSVDPLNPAYTNGEAVGSDWVAVGPGAEISLGEAVLGVGREVVEILDADPDPDPETATQEVSRPAKPSIAFPTTDEATILRPVHKDGIPPPAERPVSRDGVPPPAPRPGSVSAPVSKPKKLKIRQSARENPTADDDATRFAPLDAGAPLIRPVPGSIGGEGALPPSASSPPPAPRAWAPPGVVPGGPPGFAPVGPSSPGFAPAGPASPGFAPAGPASPGFAPAPAFAPAGVVPGGPPPPGFAPAGVVPGGPPPPGVALGGPPPGVVPGGPPPGVVPGGPSSPGFAPAGPSSPGFAPAGPSSPGFAPAGPPAGFFSDPRQETTKNTDKPVKKNPAHVLLEQWKSASIPQKAIIALMPLAFAAMFVVFDDGEEEAQPAPLPKPTASVSSASPEKAPPDDSHEQADAAVDVDQPSAPPAATTEEPEPPKLAKGEKTKQRLAADALAAGNDEQALRLYEALVQEFPDEPAYKDVVRILKARKGEK